MLLQHTSNLNWNIAKKIQKQDTQRENKKGENSMNKWELLCKMPNIKGYLQKF